MIYLATRQAIYLSINLSLAPSGCKKLEPCLTWDVVHKRTPWGIVLLLGGGVALAEGAKQSGLSTFIGSKLAGLREVPKEVLQLVVCLLAGGMTELASNTATSSVLLPILANLVSEECEGRREEEEEVGVIRGVIEGVKR